MSEFLCEPSFQRSLLLYLTTYQSCRRSREVCVDVHPVVVGSAADPAGAGALALRGPVPAVRVEAGQQRDVSTVHQARDPGILITEGVSVAVMKGSDIQH